MRALSNASTTAVSELVELATSFFSKPPVRGHPSAAAQASLEELCSRASAAKKAFYDDAAALGRKFERLLDQHVTTSFISDEELRDVLKEFGVTAPALICGVLEEGENNRTIEVALKALRCMAPVSPQVGARFAELSPRLLAHADFNINPSIGLTAKAVQQEEATARALRAHVLSTVGLIRERAIVAIGSIGPAAESVVPQLIECLQSPNFDKHQVTINTLGAIGHGAKEAIPVLTAFIESKDGAVAESAVRALKELCGDNWMQDLNLPPQLRAIAELRMQKPDRSSDFPPLSSPNPFGLAPATPLAPGRQVISPLKLDLPATDGNS